MDLLTLCILLASISFFTYGVAYFTSAHMKNEFNRFGLAKLGVVIILLEFTGASGLLVGLFSKPILALSSLGLTLLMFMAVLVRIKLKDSILISLPALFYFFLTLFIFWGSIR